MLLDEAWSLLGVIVEEVGVTPGAADDKHLLVRMEHHAGEVPDAAEEVLGAIRVPVVGFAVGDHWPVRAGRALDIILADGDGSAVEAAIHQLNPQVGDPGAQLQVALGPVLGLNTPGLRRGRSPCGVRGDVGRIGGRKAKQDSFDRGNVSQDDAHQVLQR